MYGSNLLNILGSFSRKDIREFGKYVRSPFFNSNEKVAELFDFVKDFYPDFTHKKLDKEQAYMDVFRTGKYNSGLMTTTMFHLTQHAKDYLAYINYKSVPVLEQESLLRELRNRGMDKAFEKQYREAKEVLDNWGGIDAGLMKHSLSIGGIVHDYYEAKNKYSDELMMLLEKSSESLLCYFLMISEILLTGFEGRKIKFNASPERSLLEEFFRCVDFVRFEEKLKDIDIPEARTMMLNMLIIENLLHEDDYELYRKFKQVLYANLHLYNRFERNILLTVARNLLLHHRSITSDIYNAEYFELLEKTLEFDTYKIYGEYMSLTIFDNILTAALELGKTGWAEDFVKKYTEHLVPEVRENVSKYANARLEFKKGAWDRALEITAGLNLEPITQKLRLKVLQIQISYEKKDYESVLYSIDSFRHFLRYNKNISAARRTEYVTFTRLLGRLIKHLSRSNRRDLDELRAELNASGRIPHRNWLMEKIEGAEKQV